MPRQTFALALLIAGLSGCAGASFAISPQEQLVAEQNANLADMASAAADGLQGTWITSTWRGATCRWSRREPAVAVCQTATRYSDRQPWHAFTVRYRREEGGGWKMLSP